MASNTNLPFGLVSVVEQPKTSVIRYADLCCTDLKLHQQATFFVNLYDADRNVLDRKYITISGDDYESWGADDDYVTQLILGKLGLTVDSS